MLNIGKKYILASTNEPIMCLENISTNRALFLVENSVTPFVSWAYDVNTTIIDLLDCCHGHYYKTLKEASKEEAFNEASKEEAFKEAFKVAFEEAFNEALVKAFKEALVICQYCGEEMDIFCKYSVAEKVAEKVLKNDLLEQVVKRLQK